MRLPFFFRKRPCCRVHCSYRDQYNIYNNGECGNDAKNMTLPDINIIDDTMERWKCLMLWKNDGWNVGKNDGWKANMLKKWWTWIHQLYLLYLTILKGSFHNWEPICSFSSCKSASWPNSDLPEIPISLQLATFPKTLRVFLGRETGPIESMTNQPPTSPSWVQPP